MLFRGTGSSVLAGGIAAAIALCLASNASAETKSIVSHDLAQTPGQVRDHWTPERMRRAEPLDGPASPGTDTRRLARDAAASPDQEIPESLDVTYPYRIHGRLFLRFGPDDASCSATVVTSFSRDLILTAGHCVAEPAGGGRTRFASDVLFVPAYRNGAAPLGSYAGTRGGTPGLWAAEGEIAFDVGVIKLAPLNGVRIQDQLGSRGVAFNRGPRSFRGKTLQLFGYPAAPAGVYDGERPILCDSRFRRIESFSAALLASPCHQQEGASGGGWVLGGRIVTSLTSHSGCGFPGPNCDVIAGTYLGTAALQVWSQASGGLPKKRKRRIERCKRLRGKKHKRCLSRAEIFQPVVR